ncbi:MAG TPA: indole-3-glycerol phosphate synthase TrpC [Bacteroidetes bacterium]|nr:indole-3-glycerol phosphate synthase TrpC [Bacteroidota bacterium]
MNILTRIVRNKLREVYEQKELVPIRLLETSPFFNTHLLSMKEHLTSAESHGIIAEFKRRSPSQGEIHRHADPYKITTGYVWAGASALSVLTDREFFGAEPGDFQVAKKSNPCPVLRKDFIIDEYQLYESRAMGADAILLIARVLSPGQVNSLTRTAQHLGMEILLEVHSKEKIRKYSSAPVDMIGINNRNLGNFKVDIGQCMELGTLLPPGPVRIAESGLDSAEKIKMLRSAGFQGFLIGSYFMNSSDPAGKCRELIKLLSE